MANLKEILPLILSGVAGAASPRGADVFTNMAQMMNQRKQQRQADLDREANIRRAEAGDKRAEERLNMDRETHKASISTREMKAQEEAAAKEAAELEKGDIEARREFYISKIDREGSKAEDIGFKLGQARTKKELDDVMEAYGQPSFQELLDQVKSYGQGGSVSRGGVTIRVPGPDKEGNVGTVGDAIIELQDDKQFRGGLDDLAKLKAAELDIADMTGVRGPDDPDPISESRKIDGKRNVLIGQLLKRAQLKAQGNKAVFESAVEDIFAAAGIPQEAYLKSIGGGGKEAAPAETNTAPDIGGPPAAGTAADLNSLRNVIANPNPPAAAGPEEFVRLGRNF